ncbi:MAG: hypothetical protein ACT452_13255 [Microthrixaceae bacterium]
MTAARPTVASGADHAGLGRWIGLLLGAPIIAWGVRGILLESDRTHPGELARWLVGSALVHDAVLLPIVASVAVVARRLVPERMWPVARWAIATTGIVALVSWPFVRGYGRRPSNPSLLPRDYGAGVIVAVVAVWLVALVRFWRARRQPADPEPG